MAPRAVCLSQHGPLCHADVLVPQNFDEAPLAAVTASGLLGYALHTFGDGFFHSSRQILSSSASLDGDQPWRDIFIFLVPPEMLDGFKSGLWLGSLWDIPRVVSKLLLCCLGGVVKVLSEG